MKFGILIVLLVMGAIVLWPHSVMAQTSEDVTITGEGYVAGGGTDERDPDKVYVELRPHLDERRIVANAVPTEVMIGVYYGYSLPIWNAGGNVNEELYYVIRVPEKWDGESDIPIRIDCALANANEAGNAFRLGVGWEHVTPEVDVVPATSNAINELREVASNNQYQLYSGWLMIDYDIDAGDEILADDLIGIRVRRLDVGGQYTELDGELIIIYTDLYFARGDLLGDPENIITEENMVLLALSLLALGLTVAMFTSRNMLLGFPCVMMWAILGGYAYTESTLPWGDWQYFLFFASAFGMTIFSALSAYALRTKKEEKHEGDEFIDEGKDELKYIDEGKEEEPLEESEASERTKRMRDRTKKRREKASRRMRQ